MKIGKKNQKRQKTANGGKIFREKVTVPRLNSKIVGGEGKELPNPQAKRTTLQPKERRLRRGKKDCRGEDLAQKNSRPTKERGENKPGEKNLERGLDLTPRGIPSKGKKKKTFPLGGTLKKGKRYFK